MSTNLLIRKMLLTPTCYIPWPRDLCISRSLRPSTNLIVSNFDMGSFGVIIGQKSIFTKNVSNQFSENLLLGALNIVFSSTKRTKVIGN